MLASFMRSCILFSWRFSQFHPGRPCRAFQFSYLENKSEHKHGQVYTRITKDHQKPPISAGFYVCVCLLSGLLKCSWILLRMFMLIWLSTMLIASPLLPNRPVRPILCRYVSLSGLPSLSTGRSKLITTETCSTSMPD